MQTPVTRREFLRTSATVVAGATLAPSLLRAAANAGAANRFSFVLLGDLHFDKMEHHDLAWLDRTHPNDLSQIKNYTRITQEVMPALFATVRDTVTELNKSPDTRVAFVLQAGDLVEGLCGSEELATRQNREAVAFVRDARLGAPFVFTKGNHDVTGEGAAAAFRSVFSPFLTEQARAITPGSSEVKAARFTVECGNSQFAFFDAYDAAASLEWFEAVAAKRTAEHFFTIVHPPVVPYGARATWHVFSSEKDRARREKFLQLLGDQRSLVLGGHIHKYNTLGRQAGRGRFAQFALSSVISAPGDVKPKMPLEGLKDYTGDQIRVEPNFSPANEAVRRAIYEAERPFVTSFEYVDLPGYAVVTVDGARVTAKMYSGTTRNVWRTVDLTALLGAKV
jgi:3',5'-cyclic AMP phosphodiesterase CpdA